MEHWISGVKPLFYKLQKCFDRAVWCLYIYIYITKYEMNYGIVMNVFADDSLGQSLCGNLLDRASMESTLRVKLAQFLPCKSSSLASMATVLYLSKISKPSWLMALNDQFKYTPKITGVNYQTGRFQQCRCYRRRKWTLDSEYKTLTRLFVFHIIPFEKLWIYLPSWNR